MSTFRRNIKIGTVDPLWGTEDIADKAITKAKLADDVQFADYDARIASLEQKQITCFNNCQIAEGTDSHTLNFRTYGSPKAVQFNSATSAKAGLMSTAQLAMLTNANDELTRKRLWVEINGKTVTFHNVVLNDLFDGRVVLTWKIDNVDTTGCTLQYGRGGNILLVTPNAGYNMTIAIPGETGVNFNRQYDVVHFTAPNSQHLGDAVGVERGGISIVNKYTMKDMVGILKGFMDSAQKLVVFNVTMTDGVRSATIEGTLPSTEADIKKTRFIAYIREVGDNFVPLSASWTGSYYFAGLFIGYGKTKFTKIKIVASNIGVSSVDVTDLDF